MHLFFLKVKITERLGPIQPVFKTWKQIKRKVEEKLCVKERWRGNSRCCTAPSRRAMQYMQCDYVCNWRSGVASSITDTVKISKLCFQNKVRAEGDTWLLTYSMKTRIHSNHITTVRINTFPNYATGLWVIWVHVNLLKKKNMTNNNARCMLHRFQWIPHVGKHFKSYAGMAT